MYVERTFVVPQPVEAVFDYLSDFTRTEEWDPGTVETRRTSGDGGLGTTYANSSTFLGRQVRLTYETTVHDRPRRLRFSGTNKRARTADTMTFTPVADGSTEIHYRADFHFGPVLNPVLNVVAPVFVRPGLSKLADETVDRLERALSTI